jgi:transcriptional activator HAC1
VAFNLTLPSMKSLSTTSSASTASLTTMWNTLLASWTRQNSSRRPSSNSTPQIPTAFLNHLTQRPSTCRQLLAQLTLATDFSQRRSSSKWFARPSGTRGRAGQDGVACRRHLRTLRHRRGGRSKGLSSLESQITRILDSSFGVSKHDRSFGRRVT